MVHHLSQQIQNPKQKSHGSQNLPQYHQCCQLPAKELIEMMNRHNVITRGPQRLLGAAQNYH
jgi:hypothetical protein